jgi:hypothetical protein
MKVSLLFTGKKLNEPVMWHGPIVMNTQQQIKETLEDIRSGSFLRYVRVSWDCKRINSKEFENQVYP